MMFADGNDGEARGAAGDGEHSDSVHSNDGEGDIATISEVFADILTANEDLLHAAAECQLDNDAPSILAYQRVLHRNLIEMADFVDAVFGVYNQATADTDDDKTATADVSEHESGAAESQAVSSPDQVNVSSHDDANGHTSEEAIESETAAQPTPKRHPERIGSLLIERFRLENRRRSQQRSARLWKKMRRRVRVEEGVSAVSAVMFEAAERIAQLTVTGASGITALTAAPVDSAVDAFTATTTAIATPAESTPSAIMEAPPETQANPASAYPAPPTPASDASTASETLTQSPPFASPPLSPGQFQAAVPPAAMVHQDAASLQSLQFTHPSQFSMSMLAASLPFAVQGSTKLLPVGVDKFTKVLLPPMASGFNSMMYPSMAAAPATTLFPPDHMTSVCADCVPLHRTAHECRSVRKHITPAPVQQSQAVVFAGTVTWPMAMGVGKQPPRPVPSNPSAAPNTAQSALKKVCEECKKSHKGSHHCRKILGHTAPEWLSNVVAAEGGGDDPPKRKRRSKKEMEAANARKAAALAAASAPGT